MNQQPFIEDFFELVSHLHRFATGGITRSAVPSPEEELRNRELGLEHVSNPAVDLFLCERMTTIKQGLVLGDLFNNSVQNKPSDLLLLSPFNAKNALGFQCCLHHCLGVGLVHVYHLTIGNALATFGQFLVGLLVKVLSLGRPLHVGVRLQQVLVGHQVPILIPVGRKRACVFALLVGLETAVVLVGELVLH